ncbi:hypothetical protein NKH77_41025 [Streptomyces sp. M19]
MPDPRVAVDRLEHEDGRVFVWLVSQAPTSCQSRPRSRTTRGWRN